MKICNKCQIEKEINCFGKRKDGADGREATCKSCIQARKNNYRKTPKGLLVGMVKAQKHNSKERGLPPIAYTSKELCDWLLDNDDYIKMFNRWEDSGYASGLTPSIDRLDDYKGYSFDNIQLLTWDENRAKGHKDRREGRNNKQSRTVIATCLRTGSETEHYSISSAAESLNISAGNIGSVCVGRRNKCGGYYWRYKE